MNGVNTKVIFVPSNKDIHHLEPIPQVPFNQTVFPKTPFPHFISIPNPSTIQLNDITIGIMNTDIVKDMCGSLYPKNMEPPKIDLSLRGIL